MEYIAIEQRLGTFIQTLIGTEMFGEYLIKKGNDILLNDTGELLIRSNAENDELEFLFYDDSVIGNYRFICKLEVWEMLNDKIKIETDGTDTIIDFQINNDKYHIECLCGAYSGGCASGGVL